VSKIYMARELLRAIMRAAEELEKSCAELKRFCEEEAQRMSSGRIVCAECGAPVANTGKALCGTCDQRMRLEEAPGIGR
jgi:hypothetical protein